MAHALRPCLGYLPDCHGTPTARKPAYCDRCERARQTHRNATRTHYHGDYDRRARAVRTAANADPATRCWRCGRTLAEHGPNARWTAGHIRDSDPTSPLAPEVAACNYAAGARLARR